VAEGARYDELVAPLSLVSFRTVLWSLASPALPAPGGAAAQSCFFRALINSWRDAMPNGDFAFVYAQGAVRAGGTLGALDGAARALADYSALPLPSAVLVNSTAASSNPFVDGLDVDTTGMATVADLGGAGGGAEQELVAARLAAAVIHVAFAAQPASKYSGPLPVAAAWDSPSSFTLRFANSSVAPGRLLLRDAPRCAACCGGTGPGSAGALSAHLDVRLCAGVEPHGLGDCLNTTVALGADGASLAATVVDGGGGDGSSGTVRHEPPPFGSDAVPARYATVVLMAAPAEQQQCLLVSSAGGAAGIPAPTAAIVLGVVPATLATAAPSTLAGPAAVAALAAAARRGGMRIGNSATTAAKAAAAAVSLFATPPLGWNAWK